MNIFIFQTGHRK